LVTEILHLDVSRVIGCANQRYFTAGIKYHKF